MKAYYGSDVGQVKIEASIVEARQLRDDLKRLIEWSDPAITLSEEQDQEQEDTLERVRDWIDILP